MRRPFIASGLGVLALVGYVAVGHPGLWNGPPLTFSDVFSKYPAGLFTHAIDHNWTVRTGDWGASNHEDECYVAGAVTLNGQDLVITARRDPTPQSCQGRTTSYTSGRIDTQHHFSQAYGTFEARMKVPTAQGLWPAYWMLGDHGTWPANGEIDTMEHYATPGGTARTVSMTVHGPNGTENGYSHGINARASSSLSGWHTYGVVWTPKQISFQVDGDTKYTYSKSQLRKNERWVFNQPFYLLLNLAVGGAGGDPSAMPFPQRMEVAWVKAYAS